MDLRTSYHTPAQNTTGDDEFFTKVRNHLLKDKSVDGNAKILIGQIEGLSRKEGYCWATNAFFAEMFGVSESTISRWVAQLAKSHYITLKEDVPCKRGTERRIYMGDLPREPRDGAPETLTQVLVNAATTPRQKASKPAGCGDSPTQRRASEVRNSADTPIRKDAATPLRKGAYQIDQRKEEIKENLKSERTTPPALRATPRGVGLQEAQFFEQGEKIGLAPVSASPPATVVKIELRELPEADQARWLQEALNDEELKRARAAVSPESWEKHGAMITRRRAESLFEISQKGSTQR